MKYIFIVLLVILSINLNAMDIDNKKFPYIQPVSVESNSLSSDTYFIDTDRDGVTDDKDKCLNTPRNTEVDIFGCIILDDDDKDGISNKDDKCLKTKAGATVDSKGCEPDSDEDGVFDVSDECPDTSKDFIVDSVGCPQAAVLKINFANAKYTILPDSFEKIEEFANFLLENIDYQVIIYGYTDNIGNESKNKQLSRNRAKAVMEALTKHGVKLTRLTAIGMGSKNPIADNETLEGRAQNRRIEVELLQ